MSVTIPPAIRARTHSWRALIMPASPTFFSLLVASLLAVGLALFNAAVIVQALNLYHAFAVEGPLDKAIAMRHGAAIFALEKRLHLAVEPRVQQFVSLPLRTPFGTVPVALARHGVVWIYLNALPAWLFAGLAWAYLYKPRHFPVLRDLTIVSALLAVVCYRAFPAAPPRFVLKRGAGADHIADWTYGGSSIDPHLIHIVGFNPYSAFPSVHILWALLPALCLASGSRKAWVWLAALCYPLTMLVVVVASGNHYILDAAGSLAVLTFSYPLVRLIDTARQCIMRLRRHDRYEVPSALGLSLICAGALAVVAVNGGVRIYIAAAILILVTYASGRSPYVWRGRRRVDDKRQELRATDYIAGLLFVAGATAAAHHYSGHSPSLSVRVCALLWLLASMAALYRHAVARRPLSRRGYDAGEMLRQFRQVRREKRAAAGAPVATRPAASSNADVLDAPGSLSV